MAQTQRCSRGSCAHASRPAKVENGIFGVSKVLTHSFGTPGSLRAVTAIKTSGSIRMFASPEIYHISSPCLQGVRFTPALRTHNLSWLNSFLGKVDLHRPQPCVVKRGCRRAWRLLSPAPRFDAEHSESFSHGDYVAESPARALNPAVSSGHDGPWQNVT